MGWDPSPRTDQADEFGHCGYPFTNTMSGNTPDGSAGPWRRQAIGWLGGRHGAEILNINAWNEWTEGSYLEPDTRNKLAYLEAVRDVFGMRDNGVAEDAAGYALAPEHAVHGVGGLVDQRFGPVREGVEVLEGQIAAIADLVEGFHHGRPIRGAVQQRPEAGRLNSWTFFEYSLKCTLRIRFPSSGIQCSGKW